MVSVSYTHLCFAHREYLLNEKGEWEQFTVIGKQVVTIGELERLLTGNDFQV